MADHNTPVIEEFRGNEGKVGDMFAGMPLLPLTTTGAKSGATRINPLAYYRDGDRVFVFASKGGAPSNPAWYHNLRANPQVKVEIGTDRYDATAAEITGAERDEIYAKQAAAMPNFAEYEKKTDRKIPVIELKHA